MSDDDLVKRLLANGLEECDEAVARIEELTAKLAEVKNERDGLLESGLAAYFAGSGDTKARERDAYGQGFEAALEKAADRLLGTIKREYGDHRDYIKAIRAIPLPDTKGDDDEAE